MKDVDEHAVRELELYADNDYKLYKMREPYLENMRKKMARGKYDRENGVKLWEHYVERAARAYAAEFGGSWHKQFPPSVRRAAARHYEEEARRELGGR